MQVENWYVPTIRALNLMNGCVSISTSAYSIYNAANRNDADNSSWFRIIRRCTYRSSITGGMFVLCINSGSMTFGTHKKISSCRNVFHFLYLFYSFVFKDSESREFQKLLPLSRVCYMESALRANWRRTRRGAEREGILGVAINMVINRHHKSLALLPAVSISLSTSLSDSG